MKLLIGRIEEDTKIWFQRHKKAFPGSNINKVRTKPIFKIRSISPSICFWRDKFCRLIITARPWAECGSCSALGSFSFSFVGTRNHATCDVYPPKAVETSMYVNVTDTVYFVVYKVYFLFYSGSVTLETNIGST